MTHTLSYIQNAGVWYASVAGSNGIDMCREREREKEREKERE